MSFVSDLFGGGGAKASKNAAGVQSAAVREAAQEAQEKLDPIIKRSTRLEDRHFNNVNTLDQDVRNLRARSDFLVTAAHDQQLHKDIVTNNPFFEALADDAERRLNNNQATRGKLGSGETAEALRNSILLLGEDILDRDFSRKERAFRAGNDVIRGQAVANQNVQNIIDTGDGARFEQARIGFEAATSAADAEAAGIVGAQNSRSQGAKNLVDTGIGIAGLFLSDERTKENIEKVGKTDGGHNVYTYNYKGDGITHMGVMAQEVEKTNPDAVKTINDIKFVDYKEVA